MSPRRLLLPLALLGLVGLACAPFCAAADDDSLPNFNAPTDNSPLTADKINQAMGVTMFQGASLWDDDDGTLAHRLGWPQESLTSTQSSFRLYPDEKKPVTLFGVKAYSCAFYATKGHPTEVSVVFSNMGDFDWGRRYYAEAQKYGHPDGSSNSDTTNPAPTSLASLNLSSDDYASIQNSVEEDFEQQLKQDAKTLTDALTGLFGDPDHEGFGGGAETREQVDRWNWQGHAFLLSNVRDQYVSLRIVPTAFADNYGKGDTISSDDLKAELLQRVKRSDSGDVVVGEIPMIDQGPKGYCVPATWARYLRYLGIPADMYVLAMAAGTSQRGTNLDAMVDNVDSLVTLYHRRIDDVPGDLDMRAIEKNIDMGLPLMWTCYIHVPFELAITRRKAEREKVTDWSGWASQLQSQDTDEIAKEITGSPVDGGHQRMIIGYNDKTNEIAISDSWSNEFAIRWMTLPEANAINAGKSYVIEP